MEGRKGVARVVGGEMKNQRLLGAVQYHKMKKFQKSAAQRCECT